MSTVSLIRCETYERDALAEALRRAVDLIGGIGSFVRPGDKVLLKPNLLAARSPENRVTTDPAVVHVVARMVMEAGGRPFVGDSPGIESFKRVAAKTGMMDVADDLGLSLIELSRPVTVSLPGDAVFKKLEIASEVMDADVVINLPKLKTHSQMLLTLGVKNLFGTIVAQRKAEWHHMAGVNRETFASLHLDIYQAIRPVLTIMDGVWGMEGHGPSNGEPRKINLIGAAEDAVALDMGICHLLGIPLRSFPLYRVAKERGIGQTDIRLIKFKGESPDAFKVSNFHTPALDSLGILPDMFDWFTRRFLVSKPVQAKDACIGCGECAKICPAEAIQIGDDKFVFDYGLCIRCYCCQEICPKNGIHFQKGLLVRLLNRFNR